MQGAFSRIGMLCVMLGAVVSLTSSGGGKPALARQSAAAAGIPPCGGVSSAVPAQAIANAHSVTLSWNASLPKSAAPQDAIQGYYVYRSLTSRGYADSGRLNSSPLAGTRCLDASVDPQATYFYAVKAVTQGGAESDFSSEVKAVIPFP